MLPLVLAALTSTATASPVGVIFEETTGLSPTDRSALIGLVTGAVENETGRDVLVDEFARTSDDLLRTRRTDTVVLVTIVSAATLIRVTLRREDGTGSIAKLQLDVSRRRASWPERLAGAVRVLFPETIPLVVEHPPPPPSVPRVATGYPGWIGWATMGAGLVATIVGVVLRANAEGHRRDAEAAQAEFGMTMDSLRRDELERDAIASADRSRSTGTLSNVGFFVGIGFLVGGGVYLGVAP